MTKREDWLYRALSPRGSEAAIGRVLKETLAWELLGRPTEMSSVLRESTYTTPGRRSPNCREVVLRLGCS